MEVNKTKDNLVLNSIDSAEENEQNQKLNYNMNTYQNNWINEYEFKAKRNNYYHQRRASNNVKLKQYPTQTNSPLRYFDN